ncbi:MAG: class I SAM-dependent methyltransferase [Candidatus Hodarchaeota archaeon]
MSNSSIVCRSCGKSGLELVLSLGQMPLANALLTAEQLKQPELIYPLDLVFCPNCALLQITETVPPEKLFSEYLYFSSFADTILQHAQEIVNRLIASRQLNRSSLVIEIASNDGYLLQYYVNANIPVIGIEPAKNIAYIAQDKGIPTLCEFFGKHLALKLREQGKCADVIHANNVLAHVAELNGFMEGIRILLKDKGVAVIEVPYVKDLIDHCEFDTIYHEHLCYFSLTSLNSLFQRHGLVIENVDHIRIHGGSLRLFVGLEGSTQRSMDLQELLGQETGLGMKHLDYYKGFAQKVESIKSSLKKLFRELKKNKKQIAAYGAAAKGTILLNYCGIGKEFLDFVVDRNTYKQGRYLPGVHLLIYPPVRLLEEMPDYTLLLAWNFAQEILIQQAEYRQRGGKFIIPIPKVMVI